MFKDFIGNKIEIGTFCAYPGAGNTKAEYGMILYKVLGFDYEKQKVKAVRLNVHMAQGELYNTFHPSHLKNAVTSVVEVPDYYGRNNGNVIQAKIAVQAVYSSIENTNKFAIVDPNERVRTAFQMILDGNDDVFKIVSAIEFQNWILGSSSFINPF